MPGEECEQGCENKDFKGGGFACLLSFLTDRYRYLATSVSSTGYSALVACVGVWDDYWANSYKTRAGAPKNARSGAGLAAPEREQSYVQSCEGRPQPTGLHRHHRTPTSPGRVDWQQSARPPRRALPLSRQYLCGGRASVHHRRRELPEILADAGATPSAVRYWSTYHYQYNPTSSAGLTCNIPQ